MIANIINLDDFFEQYLRKVNITSDYSYIFPKSFDRPSYLAKRAIDLYCYSNSFANSNSFNFLYIFYEKEK